MPLAKSFSTLVALAIVFFFPQRLPTGVVAATGAAHRHDRVGGIDAAAGTPDRDRYG